MVVEMLTVDQKRSLRDSFYGKSVFLDTLPIKEVAAGNVGELFARDIYLANSKGAATRQEFVRITDDPKLGTCEIYVPWTGLEYVFSVEDYTKMQNKGKLEDARAQLQEAVAMKLDQWFAVGPASGNVDAHEAAMSTLAYGAITGTGTADGSNRLKARLCGTLTTAGKWDAAGKGTGDINQIKGAILDIWTDVGDNDVTLLYPRTATSAFLQEIIAVAGTYSAKSLMSYAKEVFGITNVIGVPNDPINAVCTLTGAAETVDDFLIAAIVPSKYTILYTEQPNFDEIYDEINKKYIMRCGARMSLSPDVRVSGTTFYKPVATIDSIDHCT